MSSNFKEGDAFRLILERKKVSINEAAEKMTMTRQNLNYHLRKEFLDRPFLILASDKLGITKQEIDKLVKLNNTPLLELDESQSEYQLPLKEQVKAINSLISVLVAEVASLRSERTGEPVQLIINRFYKAGKDAGESLV